MTAALHARQARLTPVGRSGFPWGIAYAIRAAVLMGDTTLQTRATERLMADRSANGGWSWNYDSIAVTESNGPETAIAGHALLDAGETTEANEAADCLMDDHWNGTYFAHYTGYGYRVWNVDALAAGLLARLGREAALVATVKADILAARGAGAQTWNWWYDTQNASRNDCAHYAAIAHGLAAMGDTSADAALTNFMSGGAPVDSYGGSTTLPAHYPGVLLVELVRAGSVHAETLYDWIVATLDAYGRSSVVPWGRGYANVWGLAAYEESIA